MTLVQASELDFEIARASARLGHFVVEQAFRTADQVGFDWIPAADAPDTYPDLETAYFISRRAGKPLPVSSLHCENTVYSSAAENHAFRFWHDVSHIKTGLTFSKDDELELGIRQMRDAEIAGLDRNSLEYQMLRADILGQNYLLGIANRFPLNQRRFVRNCVRYGLDEGVLREARAFSGAE